jgi:hypothetical protein
MTMDIAEEQNISALKGLTHHLLARVILRVSLGTWADPLSVKILLGQRASVVSVDNSIRVEHWDNFENEMIS